MRARAHRLLALAPALLAHRLLALALVLLALGLCAEGGLAQTHGESTAPVPVIVETSGPTQSTLRTFLEQRNRVVVTREFSQRPIEIQAGTVTVTGLGAFEPGLESERLLGIRFDVAGSGLEREDGIAYLDLHEIENLLRGFATLRSVVEEGGRGLHTRAQIVSIEGFGLQVTVGSGPTRYEILSGREVQVSKDISKADFQRLESDTAKTLDRLFNAPAPAEP